MSLAARIDATDGRFVSALEVDEVDVDDDAGGVVAAGVAAASVVANVPGWPGLPNNAAACSRTEFVLARLSDGERNDAYSSSWVSYCCRFANCVWYVDGPVVLGVAAAGTGSGALPLLRRDAPTEDKPPFGSELEDPDEIEEMPLMGLL